MTTDFTSVTTESSSVQLDNGTVKYALYPVWLLTAKWNGDIYNFAMNGQTGKLVGELPIDKGKARKYLFGITAVIFIILQFFVWI